MTPRYLDVTTSQLSWHIPITGKYTLLRGKSGTGKTTLFTSLQAKYTKTSFCLPILPVIAPTVNAFRGWLSEESPHLIVLDEDSVPLKNKEFQDIMMESPHLFLIISREPLAFLPYGVSNILELESNSKGENIAVQKYVIQQTQLRMADIQAVAIEDSGTGLNCARSINALTGTTLGKSNVAAFFDCNEGLLCIVDGCGFGSEIERVRHRLTLTAHNQLYLWESFEHQVLISPWMRDTPAISQDCSNPESYYEKRLRQLLVSAGAPGYSKGASSSCVDTPCCYHGNKCRLFTLESKPILIFGNQLSKAIQRAIFKPAIPTKLAAQFTKHFSELSVSPVSPDVLDTDVFDIGILKK